MFVSSLQQVWSLFCHTGYL